METADLSPKNKQQKFKNDFLNFVQFNRDYGCPSCYCKGKNVPIIPKGLVYVIAMKMN